MIEVALYLVLIIALTLPWPRAAVLVFVEWLCTFLGLLVGHAVVGFQAGYGRALTVSLPTHVENEDD